MPCCGRPDNRNKKGGAASYYERYGYLSGPQREKQSELGIGRCETCDAYTSGDPCTICGHPKPKAQGEEAK